MSHERYKNCVLLFTVLGLSIGMNQDIARALDSGAVERGRYLVQIAGCNDCHTPGYGELGGEIPDALWLTGDTFGWRGPWGTTYATNLRTLMQNFTEDQWVSFAKDLKTRPPMPWFNLNVMTKADLRAIYQFIRHLGPGGQPAPPYLAPNLEPDPPFAQFPSPPSQ